MNRKFRLNTPEEEAAVQAGIASDPDAQEWTEEDFAQARPAAEVVPELAAYALGRRNAAVKPPGVQVTLQLDRDVVDGLRAMGPDWQAQANQALRRLLETGTVAKTADPEAANSPERPSP